MAFYAIYDGDTVVNVIVADSQETAESVSGLPALECGDNGPGVGWVRDSIGWKPSQIEAPYPSWNWDYEVMAYTAPQPKPEGEEVMYVWVEDDLNWQPFTATAQE